MTHDSTDTHGATAHDNPGLRPAMGAITRLPAWRHAVEKLAAEGNLDYGHFIPWSWLEQAFGMKREERAFHYELIAFKDELGKMMPSFLLSQAGMNDEGIRILERHEVAEYAYRAEVRGARQSIRRADTLARIDTDGLDTDQVNRLDNVARLCAISGYTRRYLASKKSLPPPEQAIKSINHHGMEGYKGPRARGKAGSKEEATDGAP